MAVAPTFELYEDADLSGMKYLCDDRKASCQVNVSVQRCQASSSCSQAGWCYGCASCQASRPSHHSSGQEIPGVPSGDVRAWGCLDKLSIRVGVSQVVTAQ